MNRSLLFFVLSLLFTPACRNAYDRAESEDSEIFAGPFSSIPDPLAASHGRPLNEAWLKNRIPFENMGKLLTGPNARWYKLPLSWVNHEGKAWIFHYGNPSKIVENQAADQWFLSRFNPRKNVATLAGPGIYFSRNAYTSASFGWDIFAFPAELQANGNPTDCISTSLFTTGEARDLFKSINAAALWPQTWSNDLNYGADFMAAASAIGLQPEKYDPNLVSWIKSLFTCNVYSPVAEWLILPFPKVLAAAPAPPGINSRTLPAIIAGLDLDEKKTTAFAGIGGRFIAMARLLSARPSPTATFNSFQALDRKGQLAFLSIQHTPRTVALDWFRQHPEVLAAFAKFTRLSLPKMLETDIGKSGVGAFASAWNQTIFRNQISNDDLYSFVKVCLESRCP